MRDVSVTKAAPKPVTVLLYTCLFGPVPVTVVGGLLSWRAGGVCVVCTVRPPAHAVWRARVVGGQKKQAILG